MFGQIIPQVCHGSFPEDIKTVSFDLILNPIKAHIHGFWSFLAHFIVYNAVCGGIFSFYGCCWLCVAQSVEGS